MTIKKPLSGNFTIITLIFSISILAFASCDGPQTNPTEGSDLFSGLGIINISMDLKQEYQLDRLRFVYFDPTEGTEYEQEMIADSTNSSASLKLMLPTGDYKGFVLEDKEWDDVNKCRLYSETAILDFSIENREETILSFENNWLTGTQMLTVNVDVSSMIAEGITPDHAGVWMSQKNQYGEPFNHYHFHATELNGTILSGSFSVQAGEYDIDVIPTNFAHRDWTSEEPWHRELSAGNVVTDYTVYADTTSVDVQTIHFIEDDFTAADSPYFIEETNGGTIDYSAAELHMAGNGENSVPHANLDGFALENNMLTQFDVKLGTRDNVLNGNHPMLHVNMLGGNGPGDTRVFLTIEEDGLMITSHYDGISTTSDLWNGGTDFFNDSAYHTLYIYIRDGVVRVYNDKILAPIITYAYDNRIQDTGSFSFECHQEVFIDNVRLEREIQGNLTL